MSVLSATPPILAGVATNTDYRPRTAPGHATILQDSTVPARQAALASEDRSRQRPGKRGSRQVEPEPDLPPGSMHAVAVAAGDLPPKSQTREELVLRLGKSKLATIAPVTSINRVV